jgi:hypothetical protein
MARYVVNLGDNCTFSLVVLNFTVNLESLTVRFVNVANTFM